MKCRLYHTSVNQPLPSDSHLVRPGADELSPITLLKIFYPTKPVSLLFVFKNEENIEISLSVRSALKIASRKSNGRSFAEEIVNKTIFRTCPFGRFSKQSLAASLSSSR